MVVQKLGTSFGLWLGKVQVHQAWRQLNDEPLVNWLTSSRHGHDITTTGYLFLLTMHTFLRSYHCRRNFPVETQGFLFDKELICSWSRDLQFGDVCFEMVHSHCVSWRHRFKWTYLFVLSSVNQCFFGVSKQVRGLSQAKNNSIGFPCTKQLLCLVIFLYLFLRSIMAISVDNWPFVMQH